MQRSDSAPIDYTVTSGQVQNFFNVTPTSYIHPVAALLGQSMPRSTTTDHKINIYDLDGHLSGTTPIGSPVAGSGLDLGTAAPAGTHPMPDEVAICVSYQSDITGLPEFVGRTRPAARQRGRVFIGPLNDMCQNSDATGDPVIDPTVCHILADALVQNLVDQTPPKANLMVWSRANGAVTPVLDAWVENLWDTRRRRGARRVGVKTFGV